MAKRMGGRWEWGFERNIWQCDPNYIYQTNLPLHPRDEFVQRWVTTFHTWNQVDLEQIHQIMEKKNSIARDTLMIMWGP